jgi:hypothetical protein
MFGLFSLLALMKGIINQTSSGTVNNAITFLLVFSYLLVWFFGLYSLFNFFHYATLAQRAMYKIVGARENELLEEAKNEWSWIIRTFSKLKNPTEGSGLRLKNIKEYLFLICYSLIGFLPLIALFLWFCST